MTSRAPGRHRRRLTSQISPNALLSWYPGAHGAALARDRRTFTLALSASVVGVTAAALIGSLVPLNSTWAADRGSGAAGGPTPASVPWLASALGALAGPAVSRQQPLRAGQVPTSTRPLDDRKGRTGADGRAHGQHLGRQPGQHLGRQPGQHLGRQPGQPGAAGTSAGTSAGAGTARSAPPVVVSYLVDREWADGFQGEVHVVNNGPQPIAGWQAVLALPGDRVTLFWNAGGFVSHHIMLLQPLSAEEVVPAGGGTLSVFFTATGPETTPQACAFGGIPCG